MSRLHMAMAAGLIAVASAQAAPRTFTNPVIRGFHPDPSICRVGNDYYLANSSFEYYPGVPIFHSRDLVNWRQIGHALTRPSQLDLSGLKSSQGIYAPTLRCHKGRFYMVTTNVGKKGNFVVHTADPAGEWSEPVWIPEEQSGIDPSLLFDDDGKVYFSRQDGGEKGGIAQAEIDLATGKLAAPARRIWDGTGGIWPEGPHLYKVNGMYHLLIAEGGTEYGHMITMARSRSPWGPFEPAPHNPVFTHKDKPQLPIQATGHGDIVQAPDGRWWMVMLATRPRERHHHLGRETMMAPVKWNEQGWLVVNDGQPLAERMTVDGLPPAHPWPKQPVREDFNGKKLGFEWNTLRGPATGLWSLSDKPGVLRLKGTREGLADIGTPAFVGRRQEHLRVRAATELRFQPGAEGQYAGLALRMNETHHYLLRVTGHPQRRVELFTRVGGVDKVQGTLPIGAGAVTLQVKAWPDRYEFSARAGSSAFKRIGSAPTADLSSEKAGGFTGVYVGLVAGGAGDTSMPEADFNWFDYQPLDK
jgi:alpha-N-arabinofuranosidase